jgi:Flp pilus assembly protein TadG
MRWRFPSEAAAPEVFGHSARGSSERGSVSAEFALAMPAVVIVLVLCLSGIQVAALQIRLQDAAGLAARSLARDDDDASLRAAGLVPGATLSAYATGELQCAQVSAPASGALAITGMRLTASSCALGGGR